MGNAPIDGADHSSCSAPPTAPQAVTVPRRPGGRDRTGLCVLGAMTGGAVNRWELRHLIVKAMKMAAEAGQDERGRIRVATIAVLMRYPHMSGVEAIEWVERLGLC